MNTKHVMTVSSVFMSGLGILLSFIPDELGSYLGFPPSSGVAIVLQICGALYFGFAMMNWMARHSVIGGIYNKPISIANFAHFLVGSLVLVKIIYRTSDQPMGVWVLAGIYGVFAILFYLVSFRYPQGRQV